MAGTTPAKLSGATSGVTVDGIDLHTFGMLVEKVSNPTPSFKQAAVSLPGIDGDIDVSERLQTRTITISGSFIGDNQSQTLTNIDEAKEFLRLRESGHSFYVIFQNQTDRKWECKYQGQFSVEATGRWRVQRTARFSLTLKCVKPYAEATSATSAEVFLHDFMQHKIDYAGTWPAPLTIQQSCRYYENLLEKQCGDVNEEADLWTKSNCTGDETTGMYGTYSPRFTRTAAAAYYAELDVTAALSAAKYYVFVAHCVSATGAQRLNILVTAGGTVEYTCAFDGSPTTTMVAYKKLGPTELVGFTGVVFRIEDAAGTDPLCYVDGCSIYEISAAEYADSTYAPPPYFSDVAGDDWVPATNPAMWLHGLNMVPFRNGDKSGWSVNDENVSIVADPLGGNQKVFLFATTAAYKYVWTLYSNVRPEGMYKYSYDYLIEHLDDTKVAYIRVKGHSEYAVGETYATKNLATEGSAWTRQQGRVTVNKADCFLLFEIATPSGSPGKVRVYVRNFMLVPDDTGADAYDTYERPTRRTFKVTATLQEESDMIFADFDRMTFSFLDISDTSQGVQNIAGSVTTDRLLLVPGKNFLQLIDARRNTNDLWGVAANPETQSCGGLMVKYSYRARYI